jgi:Glucose / Sorbosone dehydrogenase/RTX calcium-binding nonapeptide repeat (4 copies)
MPRFLVISAAAAAAVSVAFLAIATPSTGLSGAATCQGLNVTISGNNNNNTLNGTSGADVISGGGGNDTISGRGGADTICGDDGDDNIRGGKKNDKLSGGAGTDTVNGEDGAKDACEGENLTSCERSLGGPPPGGPSLLELFPTVTFSNPVDYDPVPVQPGDALIVEQDGLIRRVDEQNPGSANTVFNATTINGFNGAGFEEGLLGLVFDPGYNGTTNQDVYIYYTAANPRRGVLANYDFNGSGFSGADVLIEVPFNAGASNHNGGGLQFGPDGCIYLSVGEGGNDRASSQDLSFLRGKVLRLETDGDPCISGGANPWANDGNANTLAEIWARGFRNPWRFSFDTDGKLWLGDVGQGRREEIDIVTAGANYGWPLCEGDLDFDGDCDQLGLNDPVAVYSSESPPSCSITGGLVYRGSNANLASLVGQYIFGDYCAQDIRRTPANNPGLITPLLNAGNNIVSFALDDNGELIVITFSEIYRLQ